jgi:hypothetical protein
MRNVELLLGDPALSIRLSEHITAEILFGESSLRNEIRTHTVHPWIHLDNNEKPTLTNLGANFVTT